MPYSRRARIVNDNQSFFVSLTHSRRCEIFQVGRGMHRSCLGVEHETPICHVRKWSPFIRTIHRCIRFSPLTNAVPSSSVGDFVSLQEGKSNTKANTLSRLSTVTETIPHRHIDDITVFSIDETTLELELNRASDEVDFIDV